MRISIKDIREKLKDRRLYVVSKSTGISYPTLRKILTEENPNCNIKTINKISNYLESNPCENKEVN